MRRDSIFYQLFQQFPTCLFELLPTAPPQAPDYRFESITVKETAFQIDGVFLPPENTTLGIVYFCEVQFQKDEQFYERFFSEIFIYLYRFRHTLANWQAVVIYPNHQTEQSNCTLYESLLNSPQIHRIYLDELAQDETTSLPVQLIQLTVIQPPMAKELAQSIVRRARVEPLPTQQAIQHIPR
ncbi:Rpn family recombination-promoting nuclease/putative transposase [Thermosynechococcaceae cyanobacterium BACA0444]|uniref:Rpn family recombination-promoting nuclease/putative transposase n=1 Tax=Pseudocalidococcus azoricus BACA0444 TaxID=2918990 RepID=A0AAE4FUH2_9CYAN|nr:Rpn family recombination-promoting nuclease/putative transposase [Pseudocalidococcus azoricus]MDS3862490.1 Rpn family recombination-promoting nuclease/putative transposase [Pseudocalidococcus azoricus BACA0444]